MRSRTSSAAPATTADRRWWAPQRLRDVPLSIVILLELGNAWALAPPRHTGIEGHMIHNTHPFGRVIRARG
ncbi:hypothetical protein ACFQX6_49190 [Streptosporangium lutulentum]